MHVPLTVTEGPHKVRVFKFGEHDNLVVGLAKDAQMKVSLEDKYFSRHHFVIEMNPPKYRLMDLGSRNGTYVNGVRVPTADLRDGDLIKAGRTMLRVSIQPIAITQSAYATVYRDHPSAKGVAAADPMILAAAEDAHQAASLPQSPAHDAMVSH